MAVSEDPSTPVTPDEPVTPDGPVSPAADLGNGSASLPDATRLTNAVVGRVTEQARQTASAAKARRVTNDDGEPGVLDLTPLRQLLSELVEELGKLRLRTRIGRSLRQAADIIDPPADY
jgi:hypothetical protein